MTACCCSFCLKPDEDVSTLVAGPGVFICNECVPLCATLIERKPTGVPRVAPWELVETPEEALATIPRVAAARAQADESLTLLIRRARTLGATWASIGASLGMTRQSAWERFSGEE